MKIAKLAAIAAIAALPAGAAAAQTAKVKIDAGTLAGAEANGVVSFKGVPFAKPPVGDLRWAPPQQPAAWSGDLDATRFKLPCYQPTTEGRANGGGVSGPSSEDCLYLNVYAPKAAKNAPVMVWFFGGANYLGGGHLPSYDGAPFAKDGVITVAINYRLGPAGFFAHPAITAAASKTEGLNNYGNMDQAESLRWVKRNIAAFGGDPNNVTIFGQSAGGAGVYMLLTAPQTKGLFHKAIVESASFSGRNTPLAILEQRGADAAVKAGAPANATLAQLRAIPIEKLSQAFARGTQPGVDGRFTMEDPTVTYAFNRQHDVPFLVGSNSGEGQRGAYDRWAATQSSSGAPSFMYHFSYAPGSKTGAAHSAEIRYVWGTLGDQSTPEAEKVSKTIHACWVAFAFYKGTGALDCKNGVSIPTYDAKTDKLVEFGATPSVRTNFRKADWDKELSKPRGSAD